MNLFTQYLQLSVRMLLMQQQQWLLSPMASYRVHRWHSSSNEKKVEEKTFSKALCISDVGVLFDRVCSPLGARSAQNSTSSFMHDMQCIALQCRIQGGSRSVGSVVILFASFFLLIFISMPVECMKVVSHVNIASFVLYLTSVRFNIFIWQ